MSSDKLPADLNEISIYLKLFKIAGLDLFEDSNKCFVRKYQKLIFISLMSLLLEVLLVTTTVTQLLKSSFLAVAKNVTVVAVYTRDILALRAILFKKDKIRALLYKIAEVWPTDLSDNKMKEEIKKTWLRRVAIFTRTNAVLVYSLFIVLVTVPLVITLYQKYAKGVTVYLYPTQIYYFNEGDKPFYLYLLAYCWELYCFTNVHLFIQVPSTFLISVLSCNLSTLFRLLQIDIDDALKVIDGRVFPDEEKLKDIIKVHQKLLRIGEAFNECFSESMFISVLHWSVVFGFYMFLGAAVDKLFIGISIAAMFLIFTITWPGQLLADMSFGVADAVYKTKWYDCDLKFKRLLYIILLRSQKPLTLSALGFSDLSLELYAKILSSAWSYFSIIYSTYSNADN